MNPILLLALAVGGYYIYSKSKSGDATGWSAVDNPLYKSTDYAAMDTYAQNAIASPDHVAAKFRLRKEGKEIDAVGFIHAVKVVDGVRLWQVFFSSSTPDVGIAKDTAFVLTDKQLF